MDLKCCCLVLLALTLLYSAATVITYVDNSNADYNDATCNDVDRRCPSIGGALNITANHSAVYIYPGIYRGYNNTDLCIHCKCAYNVSIVGLGDNPSDVTMVGDETQSVPYLAFKIYGNTITYVGNLAISNFTSSTEESFIGARRELETYGAGAIELHHGAVTFEDVVFTYNYGVGGGCVTALDSDVVIRSCVFSKNRGQLRGAALFGFRSNFTIFDSAFTGNAVKSMESQPSGIGGALYLSTARLLFIKGCFFADNEAELAGGAVYVADLQLGNLQVLDSHFEGNAVNGNGNCIASSSCNSRGGALFASSLDMKISNCSFRDNYVMTLSTTQPAQGGAIFSSAPSYVDSEVSQISSVEGCLFAGNFATQGGAWFVSGQRISVRGSTFHQNYAQPVSTYFDSSPSQGGAIYFSSGRIHMLVSYLVDCVLSENIAYSGWGGAFYGVDSPYSHFSMQSSSFVGNRAYSSYFTQSHGGALMITSNINVNISDCTFANNSALPYLDVVPLTYSGEGGAIYAQSASLAVNSSRFENNYAVTGQLDNGASGGAIVVTHCYPVLLTRTTFTANGGAGYYGYSVFASPGRAGAVSVKFSQAKIEACHFEGNWVTAGQTEVSLGGAIAVFFNYEHGSKEAKTSTTTTRDLSVVISGSKFVSNRAYGHICNSGRQGGNGGAIAIAGVNAPGVFIEDNEFVENNAVTYEPGASTSLGGAISISLQSNLSSTANSFKNNFALNGGGHDLASISGQTGDENYWNSTGDLFVAYRSTEFASDLQNALLGETFFICKQFASLTSSSFSSSSSMKKKKKSPNTQFIERNTQFTERNTQFTERDTQFIERNTQFIERNTQFTERTMQFIETDNHHRGGGGGFTPFVLSPHFEQARSRDLPFAESFGVKEEEGACSAAAVVKAIRDKHFNTLDSYSQEKESAAYTEDDMTVIRISMELLLRLDLWKAETGCGAVDNDRPLRDLEERFRRSLVLTLADFSRRITRGSNAMSSSSSSSSSGEDDHSIDRVDAAIFTLVRLSPDIVLTSGRANMINSVFKGDYHIFVGNYPVIYRQMVKNPFLDPNIITVPSYSLLAAPKVLGTLVLTAIEATVEVATRRRGDNTFIDQLNFFQSELLLNNNLTIRNTSFFTGSSIASTSVLSRRRNAHPFVIVRSNFITGIDLKALFTIDPLSYRALANSTAYNTLTTFQSCTVLVEGQFVVTSTFQDARNFTFTVPSLAATDARIDLLDGAQVVIAHGGNLTISVDTIVHCANQSEGILNNGTVYLLGATSASLLSSFTSLYDQLDTEAYSRRASQGSLNSLLVVDGNFSQTSTGATKVYLNHTSQSKPVIYLQSNLDYRGVIVLDYFIDQKNNMFPDLQLYDDQTSSWLVVAFTHYYHYHHEDNDDSDNALFTLQAPDGLKYSQSITTVDVSNPDSSEGTSSSSTQYQALLITVTNIACAQISTYYYDLTDPVTTSGHKCYICLQNSTCNLCGTDVCAYHGQCGSDQLKHSDSCCDGDCHHGICQVNAEHTAYSCNCDNQIWYDGTYCSNLSSTGLGIILSAVSAFLIVVVVGFFYWRSLQQKQLVLEELADGILNPQMDGSNKEYIQYMQQALILNDVFVRFDEIKLECIVGEGSFGIVHKATFRGAQVAVKQMRSMFTELTEKEIDEFRKEAYVMSRLRHPNIVLVMGISLMDQEPISPPKSRMMNPEEAFDTLDPNRKGGGGKPQQTVCIVTEFLDQGSLADILYGPTKLPAEIWSYELVLTCALQAARGMLYLHSHRPSIIHRDLKSSNLVVDNHWVVKVTDFGMSRIVPENVQQIESGVLLLPSSATARNRHKSVMDVTGAAGTGGGGGAGGFSRSKSSNAFELGREFKLFSFQPTAAAASPDVTAAAAVAERRSSGGLDPEGDITTAAAAAAVSSPSAISKMINAATNPLHTTASLVNDDGDDDGNQAPSSHSWNPEMTSNLGTTAWCAPEVFTAAKSTRYTVKVDVYSFALVLWELWERKRPFDELHSRFDIMDAVQKGRRPPISSGCPPSYRSLIQRCWQHDPSRRPMFNYIVRYLKDELARVKRQKFVLPDSGPTEDDGSGGGGISDAFGFLRKSYVTARASMAMGPPIIARNIQQDGSMRSVVSSAFHSSVTDSRRSSVTDSRRSSATPNSRRGSFAIEESSYPESRRTLVDAVISERSLSYLTESPAMFGNASLMSHSWRQQQHIPTAATAAATATTAPPTRKESSNQWRDKYVLKFSGWKNSNPDHGLPPSLLLSSNQKPRPQQPSPLRSGADGGSSSSSPWISSNKGSSNVKSDGDGSNIT